MPIKMVFGRDIIFNTLFILEWKGIRLCKQKQLTEITNLKKKWRIQNKILVHTKTKNNYEELYIGPYLITQVWTNLNVTISWGTIEEHINIIWI